MSWLERERLELPTAAWGGQAEPGGLRVFVQKVKQRSQRADPPPTSGDPTR